MWYIYQEMKAAAMLKIQSRSFLDQTDTKRAQLAHSLSLKYAWKIHHAGLLCKAVEWLPLQNYLVVISTQSDMVHQTPQPHQPSRDFTTGLA